MGDVVGLPAPVPINDVTDALIVDLARFAEGLQSEKDVRRRHQLGEAVWQQLGEDETLIERIEACQLQRIRSGEAKREKAQLHIVKAPDILDGIMRDVAAPVKSRIDSIKVLDSLTSNGPAGAPATERFSIVINLGSDTLKFDRSIAIDPNDVDPNTIDVDVSANNDDSNAVDRNDDPYGFVALAAARKRTEGGGNGNAV